MNSTPEENINENFISSSRVREENIIRNERFLAELGIPTLQHSTNDSEAKTSRKRTVPMSENNLESNVRRSRRLEESILCTDSFKCDKCNSDKSFQTRRALNIHKTKYCIFGKDYVPVQYRSHSSKIFENFLLSEQHIESSDQNNALAITNPVFHESEDLDFERESVNTDESFLKDNNNSGETYIEVFKSQQENLCNSLFGEKYLYCNDTQQLREIIREHQNNTEDNKQKKLDLYSFITDKGLSRDDGNDLLKLVATFNPSEPIPKSFKSLETSVKHDVSSFFNYAEIEIPWIDSWKMDKLLGCPPVKIYIRNIFQVISYMLVDPEIMIIWKKHVHFRFQEAVDRDGNRVYSNIMTSPWAEATEKSLLTRDSNGYLLPLIFYTDGVQVSSHARNKITPVMVTLGNFSDELLQKDTCKRIVAYIPNFSGVSHENIRQHLIKTLKISKTKALKAISKFELLVERTLYDVLTKSLIEAWEKGLKMHVLGHGVLQLYPCICFFCGDDPCQHRISGLQESNTRHGCVYCMYPTLEGGRYNPIQHKPRDITEIRKQCELAEAISRKQTDGVDITKEENSILKVLQQQNVHAHINPFHYVPMGSSNNIFIANPPDTLHLFCAGLMKALVGWTLTIIDAVSDDKQIAIFDGRVHNFPYVSPMPHLNWASFIGGIMQFNRKTKAEKLHATGSFGGFRSSSFISMLFQVYYAIGDNDDILPSVFKNKPGQKPLSNVRGKVLKAIESLLDAYFDCKRKEWRPDYLTDFQNKLSNVSIYMLLVWDLKQAIVNPNETKITVNKMRNLHKLEHLSLYIKQWGSLTHLDTSTFESFHKIGTTGVWNRTSKRHSSIFEEMTQQISIYDYQRLLKFKHDINKNTQNEISSIIDGVVFRRILNLTAVEIYLTYDYSEDILVEDHWKRNWSLVCAQQCLNTPYKLTTFLRKYNFHDILKQEYGLRWDLSFNQTYRMNIIQGIVYKSDEESGMGNGTIYACARFNKNDGKGSPNKPRYDYVFVNYGDTQQPVLVRILLFIQISDLESHQDIPKDTRIILLIQHLINIPNSGRTLGETYQFASEPDDPNLFKFDIISVQSILRPAFVVPAFRTNYNHLSHSESDRFWVLDRIFFDRSGWDSLKKIEEDLDTVNKQDAYIELHQTGDRILTSKDADGTINEELEEWDSGVDEYDSDL